MSLRNTLAAIVGGVTMLMSPTIAIQDRQDIPSISIKQNTAQARDYNLEGRLAILGFDVLFNGLKSGIGAKYNGDDFWPAFGKGALAGIIVYGGKEAASYAGSVPFAGAMGKIFHDLGVSMSDNVMRGEDLLSRFRTDFGPIEFDFNNGSVDLYVYPYPAYYLIKNIADGNSFELKDSLYNLTPVFSYKENRFKLEGHLCGTTRQNILEYSKHTACSSLGKKNIVSHENNHILFVSEFRFLDDLMGKKSDAIKQVPIIWPLAPIFDHLKFGPWLAMGLFYAQEYIDPNLYWYTLPEMEAYTMERPFLGNHPFYRNR